MFYPVPSQISRALVDLGITRHGLHRSLPFPCEMALKGWYYGKWKVPTHQYFTEMTFLLISAIQ